MDLEELSEEKKDAGQQGSQILPIAPTQQDLDDEDEPEGADKQDYKPSSSDGQAEGIPDFIKQPLNSLRGAISDIDTHSPAFSAKPKSKGTPPQRMQPAESKHEAKPKQDAEQPQKSGDDIIDGADEKGEPKDVDGEADVAVPDNAEPEEKSKAERTRDKLKQIYKDGVKRHKRKLPVGNKTLEKLRESPLSNAVSVTRANDSSINEKAILNKRSALAAKAGIAGGIMGIGSTGIAAADLTRGLISSYTAGQKGGYHSAGIKRGRMTLAQGFKILTTTVNTTLGVYTEVRNSVSKGGSKFKGFLKALPKLIGGLVDITAGVMIIVESFDVLKGASKEAKEIVVTASQMVGLLNQAIGLFRSIHRSYQIKEYLKNEEEGGNIAPKDMGKLQVLRNAKSAERGAIILALIPIITGTTSLVSRIISRRASNPEHRARANKAALFSGLAGAAFGIGVGAYKQFKGFRQRSKAKEAAKAAAKAGVVPDRSKPRTDGGKLVMERLEKLAQPEFYLGTKIGSGYQAVYLPEERDKRGKQARVDAIHTIVEDLQYLWKFNDGTYDTDMIHDYKEKVEYDEWSVARADSMKATTAESKAADSIAREYEQTKKLLEISGTGPEALDEKHAFTKGGQIELLNNSIAF